YTTDIPVSVQQGVIEEILYDAKSFQNVTFVTKLPAVVPFADILHFEQATGVALGIEQFRIDCRYAPEMFNPESYPVVVEMLKRDLPIINGFLNHAELDFQEDSLHIRLQNGGYPILKKFKFTNRLEEFVKLHFDRKITVTLEGEDFLSQEQLESRIPAEHPEIITAPSMGSEQQNPISQENTVIPAVPQSVSMQAAQLETIKGGDILIKGRPIHKDPIPIPQALQLRNQRVVVYGDIFAMETRDVKNHFRVVTYQITDFSGSVLVKLFDSAEKLNQLPLGELKKGMSILVAGKIKDDTFAREPVLTPDAIIIRKRKTKQDHAQKKRAELHCHTNLSAMDAVSDVGSLIRRAHDWGHPAIAITDHGIVQAFPDAANVEKSLNDPDFKVIYGCEAYVVNDLDPPQILHGTDNRKIHDEIIMFDVETTGLNKYTDRLTEIGAVKLRDLQVVETFQTFVNPGKPIPAKITELTGISDEMVADAPGEAEAVRKFIEFCGRNPVLGAHNAEFDTGFLNRILKEHMIDFPYSWLDTLVLSQRVLTDLGKHKLDQIAKHLKLGKFEHHRASDDAFMLAKIYANLAGRMERERKLVSLQDWNTNIPQTDLKKLRSYHQIILVRNQVGLKNLYRLVSYGHIDYFYRHPLIPKSLLNQFHDGLLFGSACEAGELFHAIVDGKPEQELEKLAKFYDYLEIQPIANNAFMLRSGLAENEEQLQDFNRKVIALGE
ncbi:MAG: PHP domain-containing protein, partial [Oscillospiraceae bacterium]|nr:PHP domain-containing protein [Oscillospiraceae bacterium]